MPLPEPAAEECLAPSDQSTMRRLGERVPPLSLAYDFSRTRELLREFPKKPAYSSNAYGRGGTVGRGRGVGVALGAGGVGVALGVGVGLGAQGLTGQVKISIDANMAPPAS
jgi:hypothetical protein